MVVSFNKPSMLSAQTYLHVYTEWRLTGRNYSREEKMHKAISLLFALSPKEECVACTLTRMPCVTSRTCSPEPPYSIQERRVTVCHLSSNEVEVKGATFMQKRKLVF